MARKDTAVTETTEVASERKPRDKGEIFTAHKRASAAGSFDLIAALERIAARVGVDLSDFVNPEKDDEMGDVEMVGVTENPNASF